MPKKHNDLHWFYVQVKETKIYNVAVEAQNPLAAKMAVRRAILLGEANVDEVTNEVTAYEVKRYVE